MDTKPPLTPEPPQIALHFSCSNLAARRFARTLNNIVIHLHFYDPISGKWRLRAHTDVGTGDSPVFSKAITMDYFFKYNSLLRAEVYDRDNSGRQRLIGSVVFSSHALVTSPSGTLSAPLTKASVLGRTLECTYFVDYHGFRTQTELCATSAMVPGCMCCITCRRIHRVWRMCRN
jgi:hypothetical protein